MNYVILDLEWNGGYSQRAGGYINEIIEFGAVKLNENMEIISQFSMLVRPELTKKLRSRVKDLTALTNEEVKKGCPFQYALTKFKKFLKGCILMTWSTSDLMTMQSNCEYYMKSRTLPFVKQYVDLQMYCQEMMGINGRNPIGLVAVAEMLGLNVEDIPHHRAIGDSIVSAKCLQKLYSKGAMKAHIQKADCPAFYEKLAFHSTYLYNIDNPLINRDVMYMNCPRCGARACIQGTWELKNKSFYAKLICPECMEHFKGKIQFKLKLEEAAVIKRILTQITENDDDTEIQQSAE